MIICQNNQWAISMLAKRQTNSETFARKAEAHGVPHERVDGNDIFSVYRKSKEAVERARTGDGPTFIECVTYRRSAYNTSDNLELYRDEPEYWEERESVDWYETYLREEELLDDDQKAEIETEADEWVEEAVGQGWSVSTPNPERIFDHHLYEPTWSQRHQRAELRRELDDENPFTDFMGDGFDEGGSSSDAVE